MFKMIGWLVYRERKKDDIIDDCVNLGWILWIGTILNIWYVFILKEGNGNKGLHDLIDNEILN